MPRSPLPRRAAFGLALAALFLAGGVAAIAMLPDACGEVGRPNVDLAAKVALAFAALALILTAVGLRRGPYRALAVVATLGVAGWIGVLLFYLHQSGWYDRCG